MRFGAQLWSQQTTWPQFRDAALRAEGAGWDSVWTWDHLLAIFGPWEQPILEGWSTLAATAAVTEKVRLGLMVGANTFRYPGITAKLATTLDNISQGRAVLGIGGAWFEREHDAFGIEAWALASAIGSTGSTSRSGSCAGCSPASGSATKGPTTGSTTRSASRGPSSPPADPHRRLGPKKTLRTAARYADAWNTAGTAEEVRGRVDILRGHCADVGREFGEIELTMSFPIVIRDSAAAAEAAYAELLAANGTDTLDVPTLLGSPELVADGLAPFAAMGFTTTIARLPARTTSKRSTGCRGGRAARRRRRAWLRAPAPGRRRLPRRGVGGRSSPTGCSPTSASG
jgi:alkanesulfonate monooxygenase SsuD/methylene tetrahydromethanopterin reductase-like flavin-dependent oxidoreductase (luciferase family)